ncbi:MAG: CPBP family intramembrane metalloprotease [Dehalococcoidia bacterium]|nr:CPBP family intramembrane metalloprotease [Dehalococcoidia bacterium]
MQLTNLNSDPNIQNRVATGQLTLRWPIAIVFARLLLAIIAQMLVALLFLRLASSPYAAAGGYWPVYAIFIDLGCFFLVTWRARTEGLRFRDLIGLDSRRLTVDVRTGFVYVLWVFPLAMAGILGFGFLIYGTFQAPSVYSPLPAWAAIYSLLVFPAVWALMEQCTYQGYALPRLVALFNSRSVAVALVALGWGIQHVALPLTFDVQFALFRFLSFLPLAVAMTLVYLRTRRLVPLVIAHWVVDMAGIVNGIILPMV